VSFTGFVLLFSLCMEGKRSRKPTNSVEFMELAGIRTLAVVPTQSRRQLLLGVGELA
jgi:hypothetical protein